MNHKYWWAIKKITSGCLLVVFLLSFLPISPMVAHAQNVGTAASVAAVNSSSGAGGLDLTTLLEEAGKVCTTALLASVLTQSLVGALGRVLSAVGLTLEVPVSDATIRLKESGNPLFGVIDTPSLDGLAFCLINATGEYILRSTIDWVNNGMDGPIFVQDPEKYFGDLADEAFGLYLDELTGGVLCEPWKVEIKLALLLDYERKKVDSCTLSEIIENIDDFVQGNFEEGGWRGWFELTQKPENNPYGQFYIHKSKFAQIKAANDNRLLVELGWGDGFLSFKDPEDPTKTTTPGRVVNYHLEQVLNIPANRLTFADEFDELMVGLINFLVTTTFDQVFEGNLESSDFGI